MGSEISKNGININDLKKLKFDDIKNQDLKSFINIFNINNQTYKNNANKNCKSLFNALEQAAGEDKILSDQELGLFLNNNKQLSSQYSVEQVKKMFTNPTEFAELKTKSLPKLYNDLEVDLSLINKSIIKYTTANGNLEIQGEIKNTENEEGLTSFECSYEDDAGNKVTDLVFFISGATVEENSVVRIERKISSTPAINETFYYDEDGKNYKREQIKFTEPEEKLILEYSKREDCPTSITKYYTKNQNGDFEEVKTETVIHISSNEYNKITKSGSLEITEFVNNENLSVTRKTVDTNTGKENIQKDIYIDDEYRTFTLVTVQNDEDLTETFGCTYEELDKLNPELASKDCSYSYHTGYEVWVPGKYDINHSKIKTRLSSIKIHQIMEGMADRYNELYGPFIEYDGDYSLFSNVSSIRGIARKLVEMEYIEPRIMNYLNDIIYSDDDFSQLPDGVREEVVAQYNHLKEIGLRSKDIYKLIFIYCSTKESADGSIYYDYNSTDDRYKGQRGRIYLPGDKPLEYAYCKKGGVWFKTNTRERITFDELRTYVRDKAWAGDISAYIDYRTIELQNYLAPQAAAWKNHCAKEDVTQEMINNITEKDIVDFVNSDEPYTLRVSSNIIDEHQFWDVRNYADKVQNDKYALEQEKLNAHKKDKKHAIELFNDFRGFCNEYVTVKEETRRGVSFSMSSQMITYKCEVKTVDHCKVIKAMEKKLNGITPSLAYEFLLLMQSYLVMDSVLAKKIACKVAEILGIHPDIIKDSGDNFSQILGFVYIMRYEPQYIAPEDAADSFIIDQWQAYVDSSHEKLDQIREEHCQFVRALDSCFTSGPDFWDIQHIVAENSQTFTDFKETSDEIKKLNEDINSIITEIETQNNIIYEATTELQQLLGQLPYDTKVNLNSFILPDSLALKIDATNIPDNIKDIFVKVRELAQKIQSAEKEMKVKFQTLATKHGEINEEYNKFKTYFKKLSGYEYNQDLMDRTNTIFTQYQTAQYLDEAINVFVDYKNSVDFDRDFEQNLNNIIGNMNKNLMDGMEGITNEQYIEALANYAQMEPDAFKKLGKAEKNQILSNFLGNRAEVLKEHQAEILNGETLEGLKKSFHECCIALGGDAQDKLFKQLDELDRSIKTTSAVANFIGSLVLSTVFMFVPGLGASGFGHLANLFAKFPKIQKLLKGLQTLCSLSNSTNVPVRLVGNGLTGFGSSCTTQKIMNGEIDYFAACKAGFFSILGGANSLMLGDLYANSPVLRQGIETLLDVGESLVFETAIGGEYNSEDLIQDIVGDTVTAIAGGKLSDFIKTTSPKFTQEAIVDKNGCVTGYTKTRDEGKARIVEYFNVDMTKNKTEKYTQLNNKQVRVETEGANGITRYIDYDCTNSKTPQVVALGIIKNGETIDLKEIPTENTQSSTLEVDAEPAVETGDDNNILEQETSSIESKVNYDSVIKTLLDGKFDPSVVNRYIETLDNIDKSYALHSALGALHKDPKARELREKLIVKIVELNKNKASSNNSKTKNDNTSKISHPKISGLAGKPGSYWYDRCCDLDKSIQEMPDCQVKEYITKKLGSVRRIKDLEELDMLVNAYSELNGKFVHICDYYKAEDGSTKKVQTRARNMAQMAAKKAGEVITGLKRNNVDIQIWKNDMFESAVFGSAKEYINRYPNSEMSNLLYNTYLTKKFQPNSPTKARLEKINAEYGTKIFLPSAIPPEANEVLGYIEKELECWSNASGGTAILPPSIDFTSAKSNWYDRSSAYGQGASAGYSEIKTGAISFNVMDLNSVKRSSRHEITHTNDRIRQGHKIPDFYNLDEIMPKKTVVINGNEVKVPDMEKCKYVEEFEQIGLPKNRIAYAYNNPAEFIARASEGDLSKCSPEFKQVLLDFGMPEYMFNMPSSSTLDTALGTQTSVSIKGSSTVSENFKINERVAADVDADTPRTDELGQVRSDVADTTSATEDTGSIQTEIDNDINLRGQATLDDGTLPPADISTTAPGRVDGEPAITTSKQITVDDVSDKELEAYISGITNIDDANLLYSALSSQHRPNNDPVRIQLNNKIAELTAERFKTAVSKVENPFNENISIQDGNSGDTIELDKEKLNDIWSKYKKNPTFENLKSILNEMEIDPNGDLGKNYINNIKKKACEIFAENLDLDQIPWQSKLKFVEHYQGKIYFGDPERIASIRGRSEKLLGISFDETQDGFLNFSDSLYEFTKVNENGQRITISEIDFEINSPETVFINDKDGNPIEFTRYGIKNINEKKECYMYIRKIEKEGGHVKYLYSFEPQNGGKKADGIVMFVEPNTDNTFKITTIMSAAAKYKVNAK